MKVLVWCRDRIAWILGGIAFIVGVLFATKYEREKIERLKAKARILKDVAESERVLAYGDGLDTGLEAAEKAVELGIAEAKTILTKLEHDVPQRSADEIVDGFNCIYGPRRITNNGTGPRTTPRDGSNPRRRRSGRNMATPPDG